MHPNASARAANRHAMLLVGRTPGLLIWQLLVSYGNSWGHDNGTRGVSEPLSAVAITARAHTVISLAA